MEINKEREYQRNYMREWRKRNRVRYLSKRRKWAKLPESQIKRKAYYQKTREKQWEYNKIRYQFWREKILTELGNKCKKCDFSDARALQVDHVLGGGRSERGWTPSKFLRKIVSNRSSYQLLCSNCNWIKRWENGETGTYYDKRFTHAN